MKKLIYLFAFIPLLAFAQSSAVMVNSAGKIVVPSTGNITSLGTIATNNLQMVGGNITDADGAVIIDDTLTITGNTTGTNFTGNLTAPLSAGGNASIGQTYSNGLLYWSWNRAGSSIGRATFWLFSPANADSNPGFALYSSTNSTLSDSYAYYGAYLGGGGYAAGYSMHIDPSGEYGLSIGDADSGNLRVGGTTTLGSSGTAIARIISSSASINFASTAAQTTNSGNTITLTGATTTNTPSVEIGLSAALPTGCSVHGIVTSSNTVTLYFVNASASAQDPGAITIRATATQF